MKRNREKEVHDRAHAVLQKLWSAAVDQPGYEKEDFMTLEEQLHMHCRGGCLVPK